MADKTFEFKSAKLNAEEKVYEPFVYIIEEVSTGKFYIGSRTAKNSLLTDLGSLYFTSCKKIKNGWKSNPHSFNIIEIIPCSSNHIAMSLECKMIKEANAIKSNSYINSGHPHIGFNGSGIKKIHSAEARQKMSDNHTGMSGKRHSKTTRLKMSISRTGFAKPNQSIAISGDKNPMYGKTGIGHPAHGYKHTDEIKERIRKSAKERKKIVCEFCSKSVDIGNYSRWHGKNCKGKINNG